MTTYEKDKKKKLLLEMVDDYGFYRAMEMISSDYQDSEYNRQK